MNYPTWHKKTIQALGPISETALYVRTLVFGLIVFGLTYAYTAKMGIPGVLNKSIADTAIILIGLSMLLSGICYFWNFFDTKIVYRKQLGLVGFGFGLVHIGLSFSALTSLLSAATWTKGIPWNWLTGVLATLIFIIMTISSNQYSAAHLGGKTWRMILRTGYLAVALILVHVVLLKSSRWLTWYQAGMKTWPSLSLIVTGFMVIVILMRLALWWSLKSKTKK
jgi:DMSO/TMAO reductase YedYZ heme-binding membrane subunit